MRLPKCSSLILCFGLLPCSALAANPLPTSSLVRHPTMAQVLKEHVAPPQHAHPDAVSFFSQGGAKASFSPEALLSHPRNRPLYFKAQAYALDLRLDVDKATLAGSLLFTFTATKADLTQVSLDAYAMDIRAVSASSGEPLSYSYDGQVVTVTLPHPLALYEQGAIRIHYAAMGSQSFFATGPDKTNPQRMPAAYTFTQPEGSRMWFPCIDRPDAKALVSVRAEIKRPHKVLSNGRLEELSYYGDNAVYRYRMDTSVAPYLVSLAAGPYEIHSLGSFEGRPLTLWTPPNIKQAALRETADTSAMMAIFSHFTGFTYPFSSYAQSVAAAWTTSMEHQSATTMGGWRIAGDGSGVGVVAHELAHQWFGDWVTCARWSELWLNEGFATYLPGIFFAAHGDHHELLANEDYWRSGYFAEAKDKIRALSTPSADFADLFDSHAYQKGALVLRLMHAMADRLPAADATNRQSNFTLALQTYLTTHGGKTVSNHNLQQALEAITATSWQTFFDQWVRSPGHPILTASWRNLANNTPTPPLGSTSKIELTFTQQQKHLNAKALPVFAFPLTVELLGESGKRRLVELDIFDDSHTFSLDTDFTVTGINLDPEWQVPMEWSLHASSEEEGTRNWKEVWQHSPSERSRLFAMRQLLENATTPAGEELTALVGKDSSLYLQADALTQLTSQPANRLAVATLLRQLKAHAADPLYSYLVKGAVALVDTWLVQTSGQQPSTDEVKAWQQAYLSAATSVERRAILTRLQWASLEQAQGFALARLEEGHWVTRDRAALLDVLTRGPATNASIAFSREALDSSTLLWFKRIAANLTRAGVDSPELVDALLRQAQKGRYTGVRLAAIKLLANQQLSASAICSPLSGILQESTRPAEALASIHQAAEKAIAKLDCSALL